MANRLSCCIAWLLATATALAAAATFYLSLNHPVSADLAMLDYSAWLINEKNLVLYRDIFDINFPAPYLLHCMLGKLLGYEALSLRCVDGALLTVLAAVSWKIIAPLSKPAAIFGTSLFCLLYLINGGEYVLERDVLALVPAAAACLMACNTKPSSAKSITIGVLAAIACSIKPNTIVMIPVLLWMLPSGNHLNITTKKNHDIALFLFAMLAVSAIPFLWIGMAGGLEDFADIYRHFMPIYANSRYDLWHYDSTAERLSVLFANYLKYGGISLLMTAPGLAWAWMAKSDDRAARIRIVQLAVITVAFTFYEAIAGKFWLNHMFPSAYWSLLCFSLLLTSTHKTAATWQKILAFILLLPCIWLSWNLANISLPQMKTAHDREIKEPQAWRARQIATYLAAQSLQTTDTVQVLDMAGDGQAALLMARATTATRHLIDVPLYMEPDSAATQALRQQLIADLQQKKPAYIVYIEQFLHPGGGNRLKEFKALYQLVSEDYEVGEQREGQYVIYRRKK